MNFHCLHRDISEARPHLRRTVKRKQCVLVESHNRGVGVPSNIRAECKYDATRNVKDSFYFRISWDAPKNTGKEVVGYRVYVMYDDGENGCFQLPASSRSYVFNRSVGLAYGCMLKYSVTAQPISRVDGTSWLNMHRVWGCPIRPIIEPLPNTHVDFLSHHSFWVRFKHTPVPKPNISWYFSSDKIFCRNPTLLVENENSVVFDQNNMVLNILEVREKHVGCYVVRAYNGIGRTQEQRGYLDLKPQPPSSSEQEEISIEMKMGSFSRIGLVLGIVMLVLVVLALVLMYKKNTVTTVHEVSTNEHRHQHHHLKKKVYISHCMQTDVEKSLLLRFANALKSNGFDVLLDVCSIVEINNVGGLARWVALNIQTADKIMVIATPRYVKEVKSYSIHDYHDQVNTATCQKVCAEFNLIKNMQSDGLIGKKDTFLVLHGVIENDVPILLKNFLMVSFPCYFDIKTDSDFKDVMRILKED